MAGHKVVTKESKCVVTICLQPLLMNIMFACDANANTHHTIIYKGPT
jgi:hypothetical protein